MKQMNTEGICCVKTLYKKMNTSQNSLSFELCRLIYKSDKHKLDFLKSEYKIVMNSLLKFNQMIARYLYNNISKSVDEISSSLDYTGLQNITYGSHLWDVYLYSANSGYLPRTRPWIYPAKTTYAALEQMQLVCTKLNLTCMMLYGTILGSWRHHSIIPWDEDADMGVIPINNTYYRSLKSS